MTGYDRALAQTRLAEINDKIRSLTEERDDLVRKARLRAETLDGIHLCTSTTKLARRIAYLEETGVDFVGQLEIYRDRMAEITVDPEACPSCGCVPGDGITDNCNDGEGCGYLRTIRQS